MLCIAPIGSMIIYGVRFHQQADDTKLNMVNKPSKLRAVIDNLQLFVPSVHDWLLRNGLTFNPNWTNSPWFCTKSNPYPQSCRGKCVTGCMICPVSSVKSFATTSFSCRDFGHTGQALWNKPVKSHQTEPDRGTPRNFTRRSWKVLKI